MTDNRAYAYVPAICFFDLAIRRSQAVDLVSKAIRIASVAVFVVCAFIVLLVLSGQATFASIASVLDIKYLQDFAVTEEGLGIRLTYEGYIYLAIGAIFWAARPGWRPKVFAVLITILITLSGTRGLTLSLILCFALLIALNGKRRAFTKVLALGLVVLALAVAPFLISVLRGQEQIADSDETRIVTINEIESNVTVKSLIWGHGLGIGVPERPDKMEITYLEIFHKNGLIGLAVWTIPFAVILRRYWLLKGSDVVKVATPFVLGVLLVCLYSSTNPALNNPIGLSMVFLCYGVLGQSVSSYRGKHLSKVDTA
jgi:hypothetical protein